MSELRIAQVCVELIVVQIDHVARRRCDLCELAECVLRCVVHVVASLSFTTLSDGASRVNSFSNKNAPTTEVAGAREGCSTIVERGGFVSRARANSNYTLDISIEKKREEKRRAREG
jgi:hypothetical protein